jgi:E3 ubiquitin-protein ligase RNF5
MGNNMREDVMILDLNQEPFDQPHVSELDSIVDELETAHERIEERIRQLEAVTSRARQRQRWRQAQTDTFTQAIVQNVNNEDVVNTAQERRVDRGKTSTTGSTYLIAKALAMDPDAKKPGSGSGGLFDCNICLKMARDPILTCCGHLFCWPCFCQLSYEYDDSNTKECPVCRGEVTDTSIIPIYGSGCGDSTPKSELKETGFKVPTRPHAKRIDSMRQQLRSRGVSSPIEERIHSIVGVMGERARTQVFDGPHIVAEIINSSANQYRTSQVLPGMETENNQRHRSLQVSRLLLQGAASFSSLSYALNTARDSAERLVDDLETYIHGHHTRASHEQSPSVDNRDLFSSDSAALQPESQTPDTAAEINSTVYPSASSFRGSDFDAPVVNLENQTMDNAIEINLVLQASPSSSRTRPDVRRVSDLVNGVSRVSRRRRLR